MSLDNFSVVRRASKRTSRRSRLGLSSTETQNLAANLNELTTRVRKRERERSTIATAIRPTPLSSLGFLLLLLFFSSYKFVIHLLRGEDEEGEEGRRRFGRGRVTFAGVRHRE